MTVALKNSLNQKKGNYLHFYQQIRKSESLYNTVNAFQKKEYPRKQATFSRSSAESSLAIWLGLGAIILCQWYWFLQTNFKIRWSTARLSKKTCTAKKNMSKPLLRYMSTYRNQHCQFSCLHHLPGFNKAQKTRAHVEKVLPRKG